MRHHVRKERVVPAVSAAVCTYDVSVLMRRHLLVILLVDTSVKEQCQQHKRHFVRYHYLLIHPFTLEHTKTLRLHVLLNQ